jgi:hypothetical protein
MSESGRGLDHLMEQNDTELDFLSAYGGPGGSSTSNGASILEALTRFLRAGGCAVVEVKDGVDFEWGTARVSDEGCRMQVQGEHLPLVASDVMAAGFAQGVVHSDRRQVEVTLTAWGSMQRRFVERLVEHEQHQT